MKKIVLNLCIIVLALIGCNQKMPKETRGNDTVIVVSEEDSQMNKIMNDARNSVADFIKILNDSTIDMYEKSVKYPFKTDPGSENKIEHIWITAVTQKGDNFSGIIANEPFYIKKMKLSDKIEFDINKISDWKYVKNGYLYGGRSIKYFYDRMSDDEKKQFNKESGFKFK